MTGYLPNILKTEYQDHPQLRNTPVVFSIHNLSSQGVDKPERYIAEEDRDDGNGPLPDMFSARLSFINSMRRGIIYADEINTVSENYAQEITTEEYGAGLEKLLSQKRHKLRGILNGIDYETNNPASDKLLASRFNAGNPEARRANKLALQKRLGLPEKMDSFLMGIVSRITRQKGFDLLKPVIEPFLRLTGAQLAVVGTGDTEIMDFFKKLEKDYPGQVLAHLQYDDGLPHMMFAGSDVLLIPSRFEPSGLTQMEAMRYGAVPVARKTGGLADTIDDYSPNEGRGTGFLFKESDPLELLIALTRAYACWRQRAEWRNLQHRVMNRNFSWERSAQDYVELFTAALLSVRLGSRETKPLAELPR
jgi:starch synthase